MKMRLSILLLISLFVSGCGAIAAPTATLVQSTPTVLPPQESTSTVSIVTPTLDTATIMVTEPSATVESTMTPQATATPPQVQMTVLPGEQTDLPQPAVCQRPQNWVAYTVARNDTLSSLGQRTGTSWQQIQSANCLTSTTIFAGQVLLLPFIPAPVVNNSPNTGAISPTPPARGPGNPKVSVTPDFGLPGTAFKITIEDFPQDMDINFKITFADTGEFVLNLVIHADGNGNAALSYISPPNALPGSYNVYAISIDSSVTKFGEFTISSP